MKKNYITKLSEIIDKRTLQQLEIIIIAIKSIQFLSFSIVDVKSKKKETKAKKRVGRPKGSSTKKKRLKGLFRVVSWYLKFKGKQKARGRRGAP